MGVRHETEVPDADKAFRQYVEQESADELGGGNRHRPCFVTARVIPPTECDMAAVEGKQSMIGDGDAVCVASEVSKNLFGAAECRLRIDDPILAE